MGVLVVVACVTLQNDASMPYNEQCGGFRGIHIGTDVDPDARQRSKQMAFVLPGQLVHAGASLDGMGWKEMVHVAVRDQLLLVVPLELLRRPRHGGEVRS